MTSPTPFQLLPRLSDEEYAALREDIRQHGIRVPIDVDEDGLILDGHHRSWIAAEFDLHVPRRVVAGLDDQGKRNHARAVNALRRHLSIDSRRDQVRQMREEGQTIQAISTTLGVPKSTVGRDIEQLSQVGKLDAPESVIGADGKPRPTSYAPREAAPMDDIDRDVAEAEAALRPSVANPITGEVLDDAVVTETHTVTVVTGLDGKEYKRPDPAAPRRGSLIDDARNAGWQLRKAVERLERIQEDDRFTKNKVEILAALQPHLDFANEVISDL